MKHDTLEHQKGGGSAETGLLCELQRIVADLAAWSDKWPRNQIHSARRQDEMNAELYAIEDRAKAAAAKSHARGAGSAESEKPTP